MMVSSMFFFSWFHGATKKLNDADFWGDCKHDYY